MLYKFVDVEQSIYFRFFTILFRGYQQLVFLLFGIWFTMINNSYVNFMTIEVLVRSVAGSMFYFCVTDFAMVEYVSQVMQILIENFGVVSMFGQENIEFLRRRLERVFILRRSFVIIFSIFRRRFFFVSFDFVYFVGVRFCMINIDQ